MKRLRNELKSKILTFLLDHGESTARTISQESKEGLTSVHNALLRCKLNRLVKRKKGYHGPAGYYTWGYSITQKGRKRLDYYAELKAKETLDIGKHL